ncbi:hypothetical protein RRG08_026080 [Elysia crispata]|uniref:Uncharacterized protein n=1 Tax=Elysia crispata TaxID=231223 RepID=A0AAE0YRH3_9GAST|nr:hypothetical protein RRG08_026080 [Elysia crispata]
MPQSYTTTIASRQEFVALRSNKERVEVTDRAWVSPDCFSSWNQLTLCTLAWSSGAQTSNEQKPKPGADYAPWLSCWVVFGSRFEAQDNNNGSGYEN